MSLQSLIETIARSLVDYPEEVDVAEVDGDNCTVLELRVAQQDLGKIIGREGRTAQAIRTVLTAASSKLGRRAHLDIID